MKHNREGVSVGNGAGQIDSNPRGLTLFGNAAAEFYGLASIARPAFIEIHARCRLRS